MAVLLFAIPVVVGVAAGYAAGGSLRNLVATRFRALWLLWAAVALFGFVSSCKAAVERMTLRYIRWRKVRAVYAAPALLTRTG